MKTEPKRLDLATGLRQEPAILALLTVIAIVCFFAVGALARIYDAQHASLAKNLAAQGLIDLQRQRFGAAVENFRTALEYARDNDAYQLSLAQALFGLQRYDEAKAYLTTLRDREPDNGQVNLELARVAARQNQTEQALRFYHNAIYATWSGNQEEARKKARLELIDYLMGIQAGLQADAELIGLEASLGQNAGDQTQLGAMFAKAGDTRRALGAFQRALRLERDRADALAGAGAAEYELGQYAQAQRYLQEALAAQPNDATTTGLLKKTEMVVQWDPFRRQLSDEERSRITLEAFKTAGARLPACTQLNAEQRQLEQQWTKLQPQLTGRALRGNQNLVNEAMSVALAIEQQTVNGCGLQSEADRALLLVSNLHEEE